ncbi:OLC1v1036080C1 [Oldenlandia corymbosa var. corymbosa]|uniref:OLC1v1036080C1 n=1 Tax=Oldenlandia corymbosa var. corymbosa TaxID=529605 RepID=A0AAV1CUX9_OLDCO|nr:OLC1v1036080C1 [Oldenlandia corymbosa var. corymbosa]
MSLHLQTIIDNNSRRERQEAHEKVISSMEDNDVEDEPREVVLQPLPILPPPPYSLKGTEKLTCGSELVEIVDVLKIDETYPPNEEVVDLGFIGTLMNEEESTISIDEGHVDGVKEEVSMPSQFNEGSKNAADPDISLSGEQPKLMAEKPELRFHPLCNRLRLTNICFADDLMIFYKAGLPTIKYIKENFNEFSCASGLQANLRKSDVFVGGVDD